MSTTIGEKLRGQLRDAVGTDHTTVDAAGDGVAVSVDVEHCERYAVGVRGVRVTPDQPNPDVRGTAERIAGQVDAVDPLQIVEIDAREGQAILRSSEPEADEGGVTYWEATVEADATSLNRYHKSHAEPDRQIVVEPITHREVGRLADQLADAVRGATDD